MKRYFSLLISQCRAYRLFNRQDIPGRPITLFCISCGKMIGLFSIIVNNYVTCNVLQCSILLHRLDLGRCFDDSFNAQDWAICSALHNISRKSWKWGLLASLTCSLVIKSRRSSDNWSSVSLWGPRSGATIIMRCGETMRNLTNKGISIIWLKTIGSICLVSISKEILERSSLCVICKQNSSNYGDTSSNFTAIFVELIVGSFVISSHHGISY